MKKIIVLCSIIVLCTVRYADASIRITEIAWMGTADSSFGEWFELYNDTSEEVNLAGWKLYEDGGAQVVYTFTKTVPSNAYWVVERTTASSPDPLPTINDESGSFGGSGFANTGEHLVLKDGQGTVVDTLSFIAGWPAGDAETKKTMQWDATKWITGVATPKAQTVGGEIITTGGGAAMSSSPTTPIPKIEPRIVLGIPKTIYTTLSYEYEAKTFLESGEAYSGLFLWNMGDGTAYKTKTPESIRHTYQYPGTYTITFAYYKSYYDKKPFLMSSVERTIESPKVEFQVVPGKGFQFINTDTVSVDLSGWIIVLPDTLVELPPLTLIGAKQTVLMPFRTFGVKDTYQQAVLETPDRSLITTTVASAPSTVPPISVVPRTRSAAALIPIDRALTTAAPVVSVIEPQGASPLDAPTSTKHPTKIYFFGGVLVFVIALFIAMERWMRRPESQEE